MAHVRQEMALGPIRGLRLVLGRHEIHLGPPPPRDILPEHHNASRVLLVSDRAEEQLEVPKLAIHLFGADFGLAPCPHHLVIGLLEPYRLVARIELFRTISHAGLTTRACLHRQSIRGVERDERVIGVHGPDHVTGTFNQRIEVRP